MSTSTKHKIIDLVQGIEDEKFLRSLLAMVSEYQAGAALPESLSKPYTRAEFNEHIQNILNDVDEGNYLTQEDLEDEANEW